MIRVLIVDDAPLTRANVERLLTAEPDMQSLGAAGDAAAAMTAIERGRPDVLLIDMDLGGVDGLQATERISQTFPATAVILMGLDDDDATQSMVRDAGAAAYLVKPFGGDELLSTIRRVAAMAARPAPPAQASVPAPAPEPAPAVTGGFDFMSDTPAEAPSAQPASAAAPPAEAVPRPSLQSRASAQAAFPRGPQAGRPSSERQLVAVVAAKGGSGSTVVAANLALVIANEAGRRVVLVDLDVEHGHIQRLLRLNPAASLVDALSGGPSTVTGCLTSGPGGLAVLTAPTYADVNPDPAMVASLLDALRSQFDLVVVDVPNRLGGVEAAALEAADRIVLLSQMSDLGVRATAGLRRTLENAGLPPDRVLLALNRIEANSDLTKANVEEALRAEVAVQLPYDPILVSTSMNRGAPFVLQRPDAQVSRKIRELANMLVPMPSYAPETPDLPVSTLPSEASDDGRRKKQRKGIFGFART
jgi:pilus assembly protein CpaE